MADEEKASSLLFDEQHDDDHCNQSVEMEFKVADFNDEILPGWRLATITDVENSMEQVKSELCGMTFHTCLLADGTVGGPGYGYQITNKTDSTLDHKLLINDETIIASGGILSDMKTQEVIPSEVCATNQDNNVIDSNLIESIKHTDEMTVQGEPTSLVTELSSETILTQEDKISTETNVLQQNSNEILTLQTNDSIQSSIYSIQNDIENSGNKEEVCVDNSNIEKGCEKIDYDNIKTVVQPSVDVVDIEENAADVALKPNNCEDISHASDSVKVDTLQTKDTDAGSGNDSDIFDVSSVDTTNGVVKPSSVSDLESGKSADSSPSTRKKKAKPMSVSMQRLTAKKESPDSKRNTDLLSASERKAKADELRKKKIIEQRNKEDERRAAVLERKKKLEDAEREKKEALFKRLTTPEKPQIKQSPMKKRYSLSTSNLTQLKKTKPVEAKVDLNATTVPKRIENKPKERVKLTDRPKSAMQRASMGGPSQKTKPQNNIDTKKGTDAKRPMTAFGLRTSSAASKPSTRNPASRQSSNTARPATALGVRNVDNRKSLPSKQPKTSATEKPPVNTLKIIQKSKSATSLAPKSKDTKEGKKTVPVEVNEKKAEAKKPNQTPEKKKSASQPPLKKEISKDLAEKKKPPLKSSAPSKEKKGSLSDEKPAELPPRKKTSTSKAKKEIKQMTEEEAKKALAERRKKAKEEAEAKAKAEREKDEIEREKREEEEKLLAEQLKLEEEKHANLLEQLKREEEERRQKLLDERDQREREERERLEDEQRQREEEIDRKAKLELDKIQKEQERQELLLDKERIERKKRVEMIMARVSSKRNTGLDDTESPTTPPVESSPPVTSSPPELSTDPARLKVNDILRSRGFGRSTEDISTVLDKHESLVMLDVLASSENNVNKTIDEQLETTDEISSTITDTHVKSGGQSIKLLGSVVVDSPVSMDNDFVPLDESPPSAGETFGLFHESGIEETVAPVSLEEAPSAEISYEKPLFFEDPHLSNDHASLKMEEIQREDFEPYSERVLSVELNANDPQQTKSDNISSYINYDLSENEDEISLSIDDAGIEQVNNHASLNDTNNNKDFLIENRSEPIVAWNENEPNSQHESNEKIQNHDTEVDHGCLDKLSNQSHNDVPIFMNGNQDGNKVINGSGDLHLIADGSLLVKSEDTSNETESDQWNKFDERIKQIQPTVDQVAGSEENKLWKVLEGKVELSECF